MRQKRKINPKKLKIWIFVLVLLGVFFVGFLISRTNQKARLLTAILNFSESTLQNEEYLLYGIDIMDLCQNYVNGDVAIEGIAGVDHMQGVNSSIYMTLDGGRSLEQKELGVHMQTKFLWISAGEMDVYAKDATIYLDAPLLGEGIGYAFPIEMDLFQKAPDFTSDISRSWFRDHMTDIIAFMGDISMDETGETITLSDGTEAEEIAIVIPQGEGEFLWELFGMDTPEYDIACSVYLTKNNHIVRLDVDLDEMVPGASMRVYGENLNQLLFFWKLPGDEQMELSATRSTEQSNVFDCSVRYVTDTDATYDATATLSFTKQDDGFDFKLGDIVVSSEGKTLAEAYFKGTVTPEANTEDLLDGKWSNLNSFPSIDFKQIRDNRQEFIDQVIAQITFSE